MRIMRELLCLLALWLAGFSCLSGIASGTDPCPPSINCINSDDTASCEARGLYYRDNALFNGCCGGCVKQAGLGEDCSELDCAPGNKCDTSKTTCVADPTQVCQAARRKAAVSGAWLPECLPDGTFAPKQCKGELMSGRCFCYDPTGVRIFGEEEWQNAGNMTCACSRHVWETLKVRSDVSLHCTNQGNFEILQCDNGLCWCAREMNGQPFSTIVPDTMMKTLPCYDAYEHGDEYLRLCDSLKLAQDNTKALLVTHGTNNVFFPPVSCNYDGSYARVQIVNNRKVCVNKKGGQLTEYTTDLTDLSMTCNCEYDHSMTTGDFHFECLQNGNYAEKQHAGDQEFCVDSDGYNTPCPPTKRRRIHL